MARLYRNQAAWFDLTRLPVLLGRRRLPTFVAPGQTVLEVGCGTGHNLRALRAAVGDDGRVVGVECAPAMAARARRHAGRGIEVIQAEYGADCDLTGVFGFDAVVFSYSLSMIPDFETALRLARHDLKPDGRLIVLDFRDSRWAAVRWGMRRFGVSLGEARGAGLRALFEPVKVELRRAWRGLWDYELVVARPRPGRPVDDPG
jgi:S-adenosylmethionine-diacylgycerolhomoserine-N-methlytransferase